MSDLYDTRRNHRGVPTSIDAAMIAADSSSRLRYLVHKALCQHGDHTVDEVCALLGLPRYSLQPRFTELRKAGVIRDTGTRRRNVSGATAIVWRAVFRDRLGAAA
jgi:predicted transcriptional regulator